MTISGTRPRRPVITVLVVCQSSIGLIFGGIGLFLPLIRTDLDLTFTQAGTLAAASNLTYALMQVPSGYLADRFTPRRLFMIGLFGMNLLAMLFAVLDSYLLLLIDQALAGFFRALVFTPGMLLMTALFPPGRRAPVNYLGGYLSDRINRPLLVIGGSLTVLTVGLTLLTYVPGMLGVLGVVALISLAVQVYFGPLFALPLQVLGDRNAGLISGFGNFCANLGSFAFVYALGAVKDATGSFRAGFLSLAALCVAALLATRLIRPLLPPSPAP